MWWIPRSGIARIWLGFYEPETSDLLRTLVFPGATVYDIGANVGVHTLLAARLAGEAGRVIAFEPLPRNLAYLREHTRLNRLANVEVVAAAVTDDVGKQSFDEGGSPSMGRLGSGALTVDVVSLDSFGGDPDVIKIDVEGAEVEVLRGAQDLLRRATPSVILALHDDNGPACLSLLTEAGYSSVWVGEDMVLAERVPALAYGV
jgi:FkbM family methyltransferase